MTRPTGTPNQESLASAMVRTIRTSDLGSAVLDAAEVALDAVLEPGVARDIPILSTLGGVRDAYTHVAEEIFARKIVRFLRAIDHLPKAERDRMIRRLESEPGFERRVGERVIGILQRLDDGEKAVLVGRAFAAYARDLINAYVLSRLVTAIDRTDLADLAKLKAYHLSGRTDDLTLQAFVAVGLAHAPHGMATVHYVESSLCDPMLRHVLRDVE